MSVADDPTSALPAVEGLRRFDRDCRLRLCGPLRCWSWRVCDPGAGVLLATAAEGGVACWPQLDEQLAQLLAWADRREARPAFARVLIGRALHPTPAELDALAELVLDGEQHLALTREALLADGAAEAAAVASLRARASLHVADGSRDLPLLRTLSARAERLF